MRTEKATKRIGVCGDSLVINVTKEVGRLGLGRGDSVDITISSALSDDLTLTVMAMTNALMSLDLSEDPDTGQIVGANRRQVDTIYRAVSLCSSPSLIVGMDGTHDDIVTIDVFSSDNTPLLCWAFAVDHD